MNSALFILKVMGTKVWLGADVRMIQKIVPGSRWDARFSVNLHPARLKHRALTLASSLAGDTLLPGALDTSLVKIFLLLLISLFCLLATPYSLVSGPPQNGTI